MKERNGVTNMKSECKTVDEYLESLPENIKSDLSEIRRWILEVSLEVNESMNYGMPTYTLNGLYCAFASQKQYMSLYLLNTPVLNRYMDSFVNLKIGKGCIRFKKLESHPKDIILKILKESAEDNRENFNDHC